MQLKRIFYSAVAVGALLSLSACEDMEMAGQSAARAVQAVVAPTPVPGWWNGEGGSGSPRIVVHVAEQKAYFYKGKTIVGESTVSTGKPGFGTPVGSYQIVSKDRNHVSSEFGDYVDGSGNVVKSNVDARKDSRPPGTHFDGARMPYCMHFNGGYAMHEGYVPPFAASHGCIRLPHEMAEHFFESAPVGTPVSVRP